MNNVMRPGAKQGHDAIRGEVLERIHNQYGAPEQKQREAVKKLGKDEFFKIMVTQVQHQDPLKPYENEQMAAQMAQFASLEQMVNMNQALEKLSQAQQPLHNLGAANLIGKYVTADSSRLLHTEGKYSDIGFDLPIDAKGVKITIMNEKGENIRELEAKDLKKGPNKLSWDGKRSNNLTAGSGQYMVFISATNEKGQGLQVATQKTDMVHGISFEGKETVLLTGDVRSPSKLLLKNVSRIVDASELKKPGAAGLQSIGGLPGGMQINLPTANNGEAAETAGQSVEPSESDIAAAIGGDRFVEGFTPGTTSQYTPIDVSEFNKAAEKPVIQQQLDEYEIRKLINERPDLGANPLAEKKAGGELEIAQSAMAPTGLDSSAGKSIPSSEEASTAGEWME